MFKREQILAKVDEKFVKAVVLYAGASDKLFYDKEAKTDAVKTAELLELFQKGVVIFKTDVYYKPVAFKSNGLVCHDGVSATTFTAA